LALNVGAMLIAFTAIVALINGIIAYASAKAGIATPLTIQKILGTLLSPVAWLTGIPWADIPEVGSLLGIKTVLNELIAYQNMQSMFQANPNFISPRSAVIAAYALCGFANFASVGIQIGGISSLAPERRHDLSKIALMAMLGGALASQTTACVVGVLM
jgi:CNT family concentrative nucleoside transporter